MPEPADGLARGLDLYRRSVAAITDETEFELLGRSWTQLPGVFSPAHTPVTELFTSWLPFADGRSYLDIGCGAGVTAVCAALAGCRVTALDITPEAVANTQRNAERHGVCERVDVRESDLFEALGPDERYDLIFWNSSFAFAPEDFELGDDFQRAFVDPGYATHRRFLRQAGDHLTEGGRLLLGFSNLGAWDELRACCRDEGLTAKVIRSERRRLEIAIEFQLLELRATVHER
jgi:release factor glutamine methyltransferase